jgi:hypothetical protein
MIAAASAVSTPILSGNLRVLRSDGFDCVKSRSSLAMPNHASAFSDATPGSVLKAERRCEASRSKKPSEGSRWRGARGTYAN